ncbi:hypothetical protein MVEN_02208400 [Mycena venus]|uniref:Chromo domain-containing protein n=1 Tax=Mycena venus TaxID=2733690 RepID=A0A8H7CFL9_9AGAR|nr:hypothetical protein MVEN_02208400 [Mycena venus]
MGDKELFFVKRIIQAKIHTEGSRRKTKKVWHYLTEWEGYDDKTWEPEEVFDGTKYAVKLFWKNADCGPRNYQQMSKFTPGEIIYLKQASSKGTACKTKPGPGRSSVGLIVGTRVFALWPETNHYYSAVVQRRSGAGSYVVLFDEDETEHTVPLKHLRACEQLRKGDRIVVKTDNFEVSDSRFDGSFTVEKILDYSNITISAYDSCANIGSKPPTSFWKN